MYEVEINFLFGSPEMIYFFVPVYSFVEYSISVSVFGMHLNEFIYSASISDSHLHYMIDGPMSWREDVAESLVPRPAGDGPFYNCQPGLYF